MDYLQYLGLLGMKTGDDQVESFKPYYKWITFNTPFTRVTIKNSIRF